MEPILKGLGVSRGVAEGIVRIVTGAENEHEFQEGDVLVTHITDPTMVAMMSLASAIVCDIGGMTSHPSIISRELGIPCIVGTKSGSSVLKNGQRIRVDADKGEIYEL